MGDFNDDVKAAGEPGALRDFHALNYLSYNYLQLARYKDAKKAVDLFAARQHSALTRFENSYGVRVPIERRASSHVYGVESLYSAQWRRSRTKG